MPSRSIHPLSTKGVPRSSRDFYRTPEYVVEGLFKLIVFRGEILDPSCGDGVIGEVAHRFGYRRWREFDKYQYGDFEVKDFFAFDEPVDNIVTNPPYSCAFAFIDHALKLYRDRVALLLPLTYIRGVSRVNYYRKNPPAKIAVLTRNPPFKLSNGSVARKISYAWFIWEKGFDKDLNTPELFWI